MVLEVCAGSGATDQRRQSPKQLIATRAEGFVQILVWCRRWVGQGPVNQLLDGGEDRALLSSAEGHNGAHVFHGHFDQ